MGWFTSPSKRGSSTTAWKSESMERSFRKERGDDASAGRPGQRLRDQLLRRLGHGWFEWQLRRRDATESILVLEASGPVHLGTSIYGNGRIRKDQVPTLSGAAPVSRGNESRLAKVT